MGLAVLVGVGTTSVGAVAWAADPPCEGVLVVADPGLDVAWTDALEHLRDILPPLRNAACPAMTLQLEVSAGGGTLLVATADQRRAERALRSPSEVGATALGLVASIPLEDARPPAGLEAMAPPPVLAPQPLARPPLPAETVHVWLGLAAGLRMGGEVGVPMLDFEGRGDVFYRDWFASLAVRYGFSVGPDLDDYQYEETVGSAGLGRRFTTGRGALDVSVAPGVAVMALQWKQDDPDPKSGSATELRVGSAARWSGPIGTGNWRLALTADVDVAPARLARPISLGGSAPALPVWTLGIRLGATGEIL
jgi:hypothetical protein